MTAICDYGDHGNAAIDNNGDDGDAVDNNRSCDISHYCASLKILVMTTMVMIIRLLQIMMVHVTMVIFCLL